MDKTLDLDELERVAKRATQARRYRVGPKVYARGHGVPLLTVNDLGPSLGQQDEDATYIATFDPPTILTLIAAARPAETRDWSEIEDEIADAISDSIDMDWSARDGARAVVAVLNKGAPRTKPTETAWLIEWPATRQDVVRYWHPTEGHVIDPNHAVRFCRREDAEAVCKREHLGAGARPVEHMWVSK